MNKASYIHGTEPSEQQRLEVLNRLTNAAFVRFLNVQPEIHWHGSPGFAAWIRNLIGNVESARLGLISSGLCSETGIDSAIADMTAFLSNEDASCQFVWNRAVGVKPS